MSKRVEGFTLQANKIMEDRLAVHQCEKADGFMVGVFDGHGGWQSADYASKKLLHYMDETLEKAKDEKAKKKAIDEAYTKVEDEMHHMARGAYDYGFGKAATVGTCALTAFIQDDKIFVNQAGDSLCVLFSKTDEGYNTTVLSEAFNAHNPSEKSRLEKKFKKEKDIVLCHSEQSCYVKGRL